MVSDNPAVEYAWELASAYWPGLPRADFDAYSEVGADAAVLLELEWDDVTGQSTFNWQDMSAADRLDRDRIRDFYDHGFGLIFELMRGLGAPGEMGEQDHRGNIVDQYMTHLAGHGPILDYGGGIGSQSIFLARKGWQVGYADLGVTANFALWRFAREKLIGGPESWNKRHPWKPGRILLTQSPEAALARKHYHFRALPPWGAIAALDVVEHIPDPVGLLHAFDAALAPAGFLFLTRHSFREYPAHLPETGFLMEKLDDVLAGMGYGIVIPPDGHFGIGAWQKPAPAVDASPP